MERSMTDCLLLDIRHVLTIASPFLKERLFGLSNPQGNHGESIKEAHFHLDNTPASSTMTGLALLSANSGV